MVIVHSNSYAVQPERLEEDGIRLSKEVLQELVVRVRFVVSVTLRGRASTDLVEELLRLLFPDSVSEAFTYLMFAPWISYKWAPASAVYSVVRETS